MHVSARVLLIAVAALCWQGGSGLLFAAEPIIVNLWPEKAPGETTELAPEKFLEAKPNEKSDVQRLTNVSQPTLTIYRPAADRDTGAAVVIAPGGGYNILAWDLEGTEVAKWFNSIGVTGIVLKYRVPKRADDPTNRLPLMDAQRAISLTRANAKEWGIDPQRIGMLGFSAGGNLTAKTGTQFEKRSYDAVDHSDQQSCRPDFVMLIYPAYLVEKDNPTQLITADVPLGEATPPFFMVHTTDDPVTPLSSVMLYAALKQKNIPVEMHIYQSGGHGYGLRKSELPISTWTDRAEDWLRARKLLEK
ncbi:MAG: alpha/beta hydrolase [Pirellulales bacterium]|nr:alpha/beta hydrolase [Pirellulales bacterium]